MHGSDSLLDRLNLEHDPPILSEYAAYARRYDWAIIIPTYNTEKFLEDCRKSVIEQTMEYAVQIIRVNGARNIGICNSEKKYPLSL